MMNLWTLFGVMSLLLGALGALLPLLPTTPFVLLAAWCFARSSPRLHAWLLNSRLFGPMIRRWEENRCITLKVKLLALSMVLGVGGCSVFFFVPPGWPKLAAGSLIAVGFVSVWRLKVCPNSKSSSVCT